ncbi:MAG: hypothetical protein EZS28_020387, partial [Streblomastix strix]
QKPPLQTISRSTSVSKDGEQGNTKQDSGQVAQSSESIISTPQQSPEKGKKKKKDKSVIQKEDCKMQLSQQVEQVEVQKEDTIQQVAVKSPGEEKSSQNKRKRNAKQKQNAAVAPAASAPADGSNFINEPKKGPVTGPPI